MEQSGRKGINMVFILVVSAIFCAVATFVAVSIVANRSSPAETTRPAFPQSVVVDGLVIRLSIDPNKAVVMADDADLPAAAAQPEQAQDPNSTPDAQVPEFIGEPTHPPTPIPAAEPIVIIDYLVKPGDSLYSIGAEQNSSIELMAVYGIDASDIVSGHRLNLPVANQAFCPGTMPYVVRDHDTIYGIARAFTTTPEAIMALNGFQSGYIIKVTEVICIPA